ncbi:GNAT family N-acetyltransferase [Sphingomonas sp. CFBP8993]|uniref:GNAT family N-acetyltransferase n=1 Tax=Sphingomonas sp. CFBP8993 TaxID=3096526 RepID=UPI002A6A58A7|nr:GNAT family N-acetyltransferase [Sphingomonas sp. CFBP8993]MDY0958502.1 GNAT family N-acetyltransferase [Sphingomonas sp. CFBP8993]
MDIRLDDPTAPHVGDLLAYHLRDMRGDAEEFSFALDASALAAPCISFWTIWDGATLAGFAALKQLDTRHGEVKSMRVAPGFLGRGIGRALLDHVIAEAQRRDYDRISLETGTTAPYQPAVKLYRSASFQSCGAFADYQPSPHNQFFTRDLAV